MAWEKGNQIIVPPEEHFNDWLEREYGDKDLELEEAKCLFYEFLRHNITFAADFFLGINLFPYQHLLINTMFERDMTLGIVSRGGAKTFSTSIFAALYAYFNQGVRIGIISATFRQCSSENTLIPTLDGLKKIKDIQIGDLVLSEGKSFNFVEDKWKNPKERTLSVQTKKGYEIEGKPEHRCLVLNKHAEFEYKNISELSVGDYLPIEKSGSFGNIQNNDSYMLGQILGDGYVKKGRIALCSEDKEVHELSKEEYGGKTYGQRENLLYMDRKLFGELFLCEETATNKYFPSGIWQLNKKSFSGFLSGLFDADGFCSSEGVGYCTSSIKLAKDVQTALLSYGIVSSLTEEDGRGEIEILGNKCFARTSYKVRITSRFYCQIFKEEIDFGLQRKRGSLNLYLGIDNNVNPDAVPYVVDYLLQKYKGKHTNIRGKDISGKTSSIRLNIRYDSLSSLLNRAKIEVEDQEKIKEILQRNYFFDKITAIEKKENITYDISVKNDPSYVGNGFINHNSRAIFKTIEDLMNKVEGNLFKQCIIGRPSHQQDSWEMKIGDSYLTAVPLGSGDKLRGFRFQCLIIDELLLIPEKVYNEVLLPFLSVKSDVEERRKLMDMEDKLVAAGKMKDSERTKFKNNKIIGLSSASYEFEFLAKLFHDTEDSIFEDQAKKGRRLEKEGNRADVVGQSKAIFQFNYEMIPEALYDLNLIQSSKESMSASQFAREFGAQFTSDSGGFYSMKHIRQASYEMGQSPFTELKGEPDAKYVIGLDSSWSKADEADDFGMQVLKLDLSDPARPKSTLVHTFALSSQKLNTYMDYFFYLYTNFNVVAVFADYFGGVNFFESVNEYDKFKKAGIEIKEIEGNLHYNLQDERSLEEFKKAKKSYNKANNQVLYFVKTSADWARIGNEKMQGDIEHKRLTFASDAARDDKEFVRQCKMNIPIDDLIFLKDVELNKEYTKLKNNSSKQQDLVEHIYEMIENTKEQMALIEVTTTPQGQAHFDLPQKLRRQTGPNKARKDSYSALLFGNWGAHCYNRLENLEAVATEIGFVPFFAQ